MVTKKSSDTEPTVPVTVEPAQPVDLTQPVNPLWWILGTLLAVGIVVFALGAAKHAMFMYRYDSRPDTRSGAMYDRSEGLRDMRESLRDNASSSSVSGVVTAINNNTLTVAGRGTTKQIKTTDSTEYYGAAQPVKVNDSVRIMGDASGDTFTATRVMISRQ